MRHNRKIHPKGFTLTEALVSCVILSGALVALSAVNSRAMSNIRLNRQYEKAWQILDGQLTLIDSMGIDQFIEQDITQGEIEEAQIRYCWEIKIYQEDIDHLYEVNITVGWYSLNKYHQVTASTRFNGLPVEIFSS